MSGCKLDAIVSSI